MPDRPVVPGHPEGVPAAEGRPAPGADPVYEHHHYWTILGFRWDLTGPFDAAPVVDWACEKCGVVVAAHHIPERGAAS